jgi:hypothetical protein
MAATTPPRSSASSSASSAPPPPSPITAITTEIAMHLGRANSLLASASPTKEGGRGGGGGGGGAGGGVGVYTSDNTSDNTSDKARRIHTPRVRRGPGGSAHHGSSTRLDFSEKSGEGVLGAAAAPASKTDGGGAGSSAEIARLAQIIEQLSNTVEAQQRENRRLSLSLNNLDGRGGSADGAAEPAAAAGPAAEEAGRAARGMGDRHGSVLGRREKTLAGVQELVSMEKKNLGLLLAFGVLVAAVLAKLLLSYEEDPLY